MGSNPFVGQIMPVRAFQGRLGNTIGRLPNGKVALFADRESDAKPLPGEEWECEVRFYGGRYAIVRPVKPNQLCETVTLTFTQGRQGTPIARLPDGKIAILPPSKRSKVKPGEIYECAIAKTLEKFAVVIPLRKVGEAKPCKPKSQIPSKTGILVEPVELKIRDNLKVTIPSGTEFLVGSTRYFKHGFAKFKHPIIGTVVIAKQPDGSYRITAPNLNLHHQPIQFNPHPPYPINLLT